MRIDEDRNVDMPEEARRQNKLMIAVLATQIQDYLYAKEIADNIEEEQRRASAGLVKKKSPQELRKTKTLGRGLKAKAYIFDDTWQSKNYVFGFEFICKHIELDPEKFRTAIRALKMEHIRGVWDKARGRGHHKDD